MNSNYPLVSIFIPTYNYANFILRAIESIFLQNYPSDKIEIIVYDDGSTDNTEQVLKPLIDAKKIQYYFDENKGKAAATYEAIKKCTGEYIFNLDADDYFYPHKIKSFVNAYLSDPSVVHVGSPAVGVFIDRPSVIESIPYEVMNKTLNGKFLIEYFYKNMTLFGGGSTYSAKASVLKKVVIPADVDMYIDEFLLLVVLNEGNSIILNEPFSVWRGHGENYSNNNFTYEKKIKNERRLLSSSEGIFKYLIQNKFDQNIITIYSFLHEFRKIMFKELTKEKSLQDIVDFYKIVYTRIKPGKSFTKKYKAANRLIPMSALQFLKNLKK